jgi:hypothetical protein
MRKLFVFLCVIGLILSGTSTLFGGGADNKTNWSVEYIRTLNRNAATDSADIVMYNPAGVMKMEDGLYGNVSAHYILKDYNNQINGVDFDQDESSVLRWCRVCLPSINKTVGPVISAYPMWSAAARSNTMMDCSRHFKSVQGLKTILMGF